VINSVYPIKPGNGTVTARAVRDGVPVQIPDVTVDELYASQEGARRADYRSLLGVPMLRDGKVVGALGLARKTPGLFPDKQVRLLQDLRPPGGDRHRERAPVQRRPAKRAPRPRRRTRPRARSSPR
jgi:hypothetical protein